MLIDVVEARALDAYRLWLRFEDGAEGEVALGELIPFQGVFEPLSDPGYFAQVAVNQDLGTVVWPNGVLYARVTGEEIDLMRPGSAA